MNRLERCASPCAWRTDGRSWGGRVRVLSAPSVWCGPPKVGGSDLNKALNKKRDTGLAAARIGAKPQHHVRRRQLPGLWPSGLHRQSQAALRTLLLTLPTCGLVREGRAARHRRGAGAVARPSRDIIDNAPSRRHRRANWSWLASTVFDECTGPRGARLYLHSDREADIAERQRSAALIGAVIRCQGVSGRS